MLSRRICVLFVSSLYFLILVSSTKLLNLSATNDVIENIVTENIASTLGKVLSRKLALSGALRTKFAAGEAESMYRKAQVSKSGLPHCNRVAVVTGEIVSENIDQARVEIVQTLHLQMGLYETACFYVDFADDGNSSPQVRNLAQNKSLLYTLQYIKLEDHHPIRESYQFGIPQLQSDCKCDCPGGETHCKREDKYKNCTTGAACYRIYHHHQVGRGCPESTGLPSLCCDVSIEPYKNLIFRAVKISNPTTFAEFRYTVRQWYQDRWVSISKNENLRLSLRNGKDFQLGSDKLNLHVSGSSPHPLTSDMYFIKDGEHKLRHGVPLNRQNEWTLEKLGWFRFKDGVWSVRNGNVKFNDAHHVSVKNCIDQTYSDTYNAEFYITTDSDKRRTAFIERYLDRFVEHTEYWILKNEIILEKGQARTAVITHRESQNLQIDIVMKSKPVIRFFETVSSFRDFIGKIQLDRHSNRFLNVTFIGAHGAINGIIYKTEERTVPDHAMSYTFGSWTSPRNVSALFALPSSVNGSRWVCFYPNGFPHAKVCHWLEFDSQKLLWFQVPKSWSEREGSCENCNEFTASNFWSYLNPRSWFNGVGSGVEALAMGFEIFIYIIALLILFGIFRKCIYPLMKWAFSSDKTAAARKEKPTNV